MSRSLRLGPFTVTVTRSAEPALRLQERDVDDAMRFFAARDRGSAPAGADLAEAVRALTWYHTIELPGGVVTPGFFDHRPLVPGYGLPASLAGRRALDVATFDGFWAFELERRGAEVTAIDLARTSDLDLPPPIRRRLVSDGLDGPLGQGFALAAEALGSGVERVVRSVYDLDPDDLGTFDLVHVGDLLLHLESPLRALRAVRSVTGGTAVIADAYSEELADPARHLVEYKGGWWGVQWWLPSLDALAQMVIDAGFGTVRVHTTFNLDTPDGRTGIPRAVLIATP